MLISYVDVSTTGSESDGKIRVEFEAKFNVTYLLYRTHSGDAGEANGDGLHLI